ncbi:MAG: ATP-binding cassette domain-containing protein [Candidatus Rokubacteria bacterium]|nr:ATP-binding cassette domain-containing protein [Candidatus Rokubacteria bacterium]
MVGGRSCVPAHSSTFGRDCAAIALTVACPGRGDGPCDGDFDQVSLLCWNRLGQFQVSLVQNLRADNFHGNPPRRSWLILIVVDAATVLLSFSGRRRAPRLRDLRPEGRPGDQSSPDTLTGLLGAIARRGLGYVPENRDIFPTLTVRQNLLLGVKNLKHPGRRSMEDMFRLFPNLRERADNPGGVLSGGEQQMLTICRTLMGDPDLIMVDEPTEGLAPLLVRQVADFLAEIAQRGISVLLVEQKLTIALNISRRVYVMGHGKIVFEGTPADLRGTDAVRKEWLEV